MISKKCSVAQGVSMTSMWQCYTKYIGIFILIAFSLKGDAKF